MIGGEKRETGMTGGMIGKIVRRLLRKVGSKFRFKDVQ